MGREEDSLKLGAVGALAGGALLISLLAIAISLALGGSDEPSAAATGEPITFDIDLSDLDVQPASIDVPAGSEVIVNVTNNGQTAHDLKLNGQTGTDLIEPGQSERATLGVVTESAEAWCTVPGHKEGGMVLEINVTGSAPASAGSRAAAPASSGAEIDFAAEPAADFKPYDPTLRPAPGGREHELTIHATEKVIEVSPGVTQEMWTFNDQVPGPVLRGKVGDIFTIKLVNDGKLGHSIDFHASKVAWDDEMRTIAPGESLRYQFEAKHAGVFMYHCGTAPALHHIGNGMYGAIVIDPPNLAPVEKEYLFVQSELYTGAEGKPGDLAKMQTEAFDAVVFNGYVNQYLTHPIKVNPNERIRVFVLDAGPNENSSFHIVGTIFDTMFKEGAYTLQRDSSRGGAQALDLQPAQGGFVEFTVDERGLYPIVTHKFANVGKGAIGLFQAGRPHGTGGGGH